VLWRDNEVHDALKALRSLVEREERTAVAATLRGTVNIFDKLHSVAEGVSFPSQKTGEVTLLRDSDARYVKKKTDELAGVHAFIPLVICQLKKISLLRGKTDV
jgi:hypothetical protein